MNEVPGKMVTNPLVVTQATDDGAVLLEMATGDCFELNRVGAEIWTRLAKGESLAEIVATVATQYDVPTSTIESDAGSLIADLMRRGLVSSPT